MRFMRWSYEQLMECPDDYIEVISDEAKRESDAIKRARKGY